MNTLNDIKEVIFHELGHVLVYILANSNEETYICEINFITLGYKNAVVPKENLYYYEVLKPHDHIYENSLKVKRTLCWIILQFAGCVFESYFEKSEFDNCFCSKRDCSGKKDFDNLYYFKRFAAIKIDDKDIERLRKRYFDFLIHHNLFEKCITYLNHFLSVFDSNEGICLLAEDIEILTSEIKDMVLNKEIIKSFYDLILDEEKKIDTIAL